MENIRFIESIDTIIYDLSRELPKHQRYNRLLQAWRDIFLCDACVLLKLEGDNLVPKSANGLQIEAMGRHFPIAEHPRFEQILANYENEVQKKVLRFDAACDLPDPYDGLIQTPDGQLNVHDCMGAVLVIDNKPWGIVTMDALNPQRFDFLDPQILNSMIGLTEVVIKTANLIFALDQRVQRQEQVTASLISEKFSEDMIGSSSAMNMLNLEIDLVADSDLAALIYGESGSGKELVARRIHMASKRANEALITVNCAALPETMVESELFGHVAGAFTGATKNRLGKFELADGGTLFLDEIGELPMSIQAKLLRVIQFGELQRLGSDKPHKVDVRLITATNRDLAKEVAEGRFRDDLYHRLTVYPLKVPSLRERGNDILLLAGNFLAKIQRKVGINNLTLAKDAERALLRYEWPGNVRELEHLLSRASLRAAARNRKDDRVVILESSDLDIETANDGSKLGFSISMDRSAAMSDDSNVGQDEIVINPSANDNNLKQITDDFQTQFIKNMLVENNGNSAATARAIGVDRSNLHRLMKRLDIQ
ncbi:nitric oxide reductase transcriptional regulator NorR [Moritella viscosa]|uniref:nitric oxide reductase transcriptional regulator NorR n=1 Tax=Moritella viscosa TaxID=80854 RepID=UPI000917A22C|nr:nitric oxide reductase transcriptional regulator NorR [Moritella viscosa]SGZ05013.1 Anaerobic nitric oxide reductase transcription regulator [Moritella viscosa]SGZ05289.1 Anaerobic nitric oxide reductase transcription regulator [Moritella viscosa]SGZ12133.1 Anaerobic nitric oxide reductase transcription regulator [Moritella viscosa]SHO13823.1 Anaerobic nitric oxide reductase transcription regulator [Moritella viscosa]